LRGILVLQSALKVLKSAGKDEEMKMNMQLSCFVLLACAAVTNAVVLPLNADPAVPADQRGYSQFYAPQGDNQFYGGVSWAVYEKNQYVGNLLPQFANDYNYVYAYQVENSFYSTVDMLTFSVDLPAGNDIYNIGYDGGKAVLGGIWSSQQSISGDVAKWEFNPDTLNPGTHSIVLILTSMNPFVMSDGDFTASGITGYVGASVPVPTPEPVTVVLFGMGAVAVLRKRATI
jgi:hypothetical protein